MIEIKGSELVRVLTNVGLWHDPGAMTGLAYLHFEGASMDAYATDGYVAATDALETALHEDGGGGFFALSESEMDRLLLAAREVKTKTITLEVDLRIKLPYVFNEDEKGKISISEDEGSTEIGIVANPPEWCVALAEEMIEPVGMAYEVFAMRPERWLKLSRVKADKNAPIDVIFLQPWNQKAPAMAAIKIGGTFRALVNFVEREKAKEAIGENAKGWMW